MIKDSCPLQVKGPPEENSLTYQMPFEEQPEQIQMADNVQYMSSTDNMQSEHTLKWKKTEILR